MPGGDQGTDGPANRFPDARCSWDRHRCTQRLSRPVSATTAGQSGQAGAPEVGWLALRPERIAPGSDPAGVIPGIACLAFGVGRHGAAWLDRLSRSQWHRGLAPTAQDLTTAGGRAAGSFPLSAVSDTRAACPADLPLAPMATVAVGRFAAHAEQAATVELVGRLRQRRPDGRIRMTVLATVERGAGIAASLAAEGAFVVEGAPGVPAQHLHHFPLRAAIPPRAGRIICADLADHLVTWPRGRRSQLHAIPTDADAAERYLHRGIATGMIPATARLLNLHWLQRARRPQTLAELDGLAARMMRVFDDSPAHWIYTDAEPMDASSKRADLLLAR